MDIGDILCCKDKDEVKNILHNCSNDDLKRYIENFYDMFRSICDEINKY